MRYITYIDSPLLLKEFCNSFATTWARFVTYLLVFILGDALVLLTALFLYRRRQTIIRVWKALSHVTVVYTL